MTKDEIMNTYAIEQGYESWEDLYTQRDRIFTHFNNVTDLIQEELLKRVTENALIRHDYNSLNCPNDGESQKIFKGMGADFYEVDRNSILNTEIL
ncbi:hypothetical protein IF125_08625 [Empedobacter stercoris]|uniref:hypothetical protein n=1 Tax=Empedobacter stercoris TaxID=1628248 RepID=UPI001CE0A78A|nr:hypothetical protein [Empedobacter stercoris]MCA4782329.1 hypothetical protein [Empedobacter stercoris]